jgi:hypothetical protein
MAASQPVAAPRSLMPISQSHAQKTLDGSTSRVSRIRGTSMRVHLTAVPGLCWVPGT